MFCRTLMLLVATGSLADSQFFTGRRQNYNSNANMNEVFSGYSKRLRPDLGVGRARAGFYGSPKYDIVLGPDMAKGKDRGGLFGGAPKYDIVLGPDMANGKERSGLYGGSPKYDIVLGPDVIKGKERGGLYGGSPKYEIVLGADMANGKDRGGLYGGPQKFEIILEPDMVKGRDRGGLLKLVKGGTGSGGVASDYLASEDNADGGGYGRGSCDALADILLREDDDELAVNEEPTDVDGSLEGQFEDNGNYNVVFKGSNRRHLSQQPYGVNSGPWESNGLNSNAVGSKNHRTYNWGTLRPPNLNVDESERINQDYDRNNLPYDRTEQDYERDYRGTNVNSNTNYNVFGGRRGNENSNTNDVVINYDGVGQDEGNRRYVQDEGNGYSATPSYSGYGRAGPGLQGSYGSHTTGYPMGGYTPRPAYPVLRDSDVSDDDDDDADPEQNVNSNINSNVNSNVNIMSRRQNIKSRPNNSLFPRKKRSISTSSSVSGRLDRAGNDGVSTVPNLDISTVAKPVAEILEKPRSSIHRNLM